MLNSVLEGVGNTPLLHLAALDADLPGNVFVKLESRNPGGSIKDRVALHLIRCALCDGTLKPGSTVLEATSGNMGIGIALAARAHGTQGRSDHAGNHERRAPQTHSRIWRRGCAHARRRRA